MARHEKPTKNNDIIVNQHIIPRIHILQWSSDDKGVQVVQENKIDSYSVKNPFFCGMRLWDQQTEKDMLDSNEKIYIRQIENYLENNKFSNELHVKEYYALLCVRQLIKYKGRPTPTPSIFENINISNPTKKELEDEEKNNIGAVKCLTHTTDKSSQHTDRGVVSILMTPCFFHFMFLIEHIDWKLMHFDSPIILPDALFKNFDMEIHILPINPYMAYVSKSFFDIFNESDSKSEKVNTYLIENCTNKYYIMNKKITKEKTESNLRKYYIQK